MPVVNKLATIIRNDLTTYTNWLALGTTTTDTISIASTSLSGEYTTLPIQSISYPSDKKYTVEFILGPNQGNGQTYKRIALKETSTTTDVVTISNIVALDKNELVGAAFEVTLEVINQ